MRLIIIALTISLTACATIKLTADGEKVRVLEPNEVNSCRELGKTNTSVTSTIIVERPIEAITKELRIIGRNAAAGMGGDTIVPLTVIDQGRQSFVVYKCVNPGG